MPWEFLGGVHTKPEGFENRDFTLKTQRMFSFTLRRTSLKTQQSPVILDFCLRESRSGKSHDYYDAIVFEKLRFHIVFSPH